MRASASCPAFSSCCASAVMLLTCASSCFYGGGTLGFLLDKLESLNACRCQPAIQTDSHPERAQVDVPGVDHRIEEGNTTFHGDTEYVCVQKFENRDSHLLIATPAELRHP